MGLSALYSITVFLSSLLLFLIQPMLAGRLLPLFGGAAGVWAVSMFFFPAILLIGYTWANKAARMPKAAAAVVLISLFFLPVSLPETTASTHPVLELLRILTASAGLPILALSATSPTVQSWFASYRIYVISNIAALLALLSYPFLIEPNIGKSSQLRVWSIAYGLYAVCYITCALRSQPAQRPERTVTKALWPQWILLSALPAGLWLSVANQLSQSVAPVPLLWIVPLSTYLLTLILCFEGRFYRTWIFKWLLTPAIAALLFASKQHYWNTSLPVGLAVFVFGLFVCCMICHGELAALRPPAGTPTHFYLAMAIGGAAGSAFVSLLAPAIFPDYLEFHIIIIALVIAGFALLYVKLTPAHLVRLCIVSAIAFTFSEYQNTGGLRVRNFYGVLEVQDKPGYRILSNGTIIHGLQFREAHRTKEATTYYSPESGIGQILTRPSTGPRKAGFIGLGAGTLSTYGKESDVFRYYEINPDVIDIARKYFLFLSQSKARIEIVPDDARLALQREAPQNYDLLAVDAFSGDAVPTHLITREAFQLYLRHLKPDGVLAVHVTGKYLHLAPIVQRIADSLGKPSRIVINKPDSLRQVMRSTWVILEGEKTSTMEPNAWSDDHVKLWEAFR